MQSRDLVEAHRLVFSAKLYDHQGPIARGGRTNPPPPDRPRYEKCPDRARVNTMQLHIFILFLFLCNKRCSKAIFRVLDETPNYKHVLRRQLTEIGNLTSWPQMTLTSEKVTSGLGRCLDMSQTRIMSIHRLLIRLFSEFCEGKAINGKCQTFCVWPDMWRHRWPQGQIFKLYPKDLVQACPLPVEFFRHVFWLPI